MGIRQPTHSSRALCGDWAGIERVAGVLSLHQRSAGRMPFSWHGHWQRILLIIILLSWYQRCWPVFSFCCFCQSWSDPAVETGPVLSIGPASFFFISRHRFEQVTRRTFSTRFNTWPAQFFFSFFSPHKSCPIIRYREGRGSICQSAWSSDYHPIGKITP